METKIKSGKKIRYHLQENRFPEFGFHFYLPNFLISKLENALEY